MRKPVSRVAVALLVTTLTACALLVGAVPVQARRAVQPVTMSVVDVTPNTPSVTTKPRPLTFTLQVVNHTDKRVHVSISVSRGDPIGSTAALDSAIAKPKAPSPQLVSPLTATAEVTVPANTSKPALLETTTATTTVTAAHNGVCLCHDAIYPFWFIGSYTVDGTSGDITTQTLVPSFTKSPAKSPVSWVWPLLDRPHRLLRSNVFLDDDLAGEVSPGGRLYNLLQVVQQVSSSVPMTVVTDPDLIDELAVMAGGHYYVKKAHGLVPGTGAEVARAWLISLRHALRGPENLTRLVFTPFADPAVDSLARNGMTWLAGLDANAQQRVTHALGDRTPLSDLAWPAGTRLSPSTLSQLVSKGANTVVVGDSALTGGEVSPTPDALAPISTGAGPPATLAVTSTVIQRLVARILDPAGGGLTLLPELVAHLALRTMLDGPHYTVITPPRELDVAAPDVAVKTIEATAHSTWSRPITVEDAVTDPTISKSPRGKLITRPRGPQLSRHLLADLRQVSGELPPLITVFHDSAVGAHLAAPVPAAVQRAENSSLLTDRARAGAMGDRLVQVINHTRRAVYIQRPTNGTYTLTSKDSLLPITVVNRLGAEIDVQVSVDAVDGDTGLSNPNTDNPFTIKPNSRVQVHIPLHLTRVGRIKLIARVQTPDGLTLGYGKRETPLSVRSTAIGTIGVIITILAAVALALAVVLRQVRRIRGRNRTAPPEEPMPPVAATTASGAQ